MFTGVRHYGKITVLVALMIFVFSSLVLAEPEKGIGMAGNLRSVLSARRQNIKTNVVSSEQVKADSLIETVKMEISEKVGSKSEAPRVKVFEGSMLGRMFKDLRAKESPRPMTQSRLRMGPLPMNNDLKAKEFQQPMTQNRLRMGPLPVSNNLLEE